MDARTLEYLRAMQRSIAVVARHAELQLVTAESRAFDLFRDAVTELENWEQQRHSNEMEIQLRRVETDEALNRLLGDLACVQAAAELTSSHVAPLPVFKLPSPRDHVVRIIAVARGILSVACQYDSQLVDAGMHPRKLADVEKSADELSNAHLQWAIAEAYSDTFPDSLLRLKEHVRKRHRQVYLELRSAMTHQARSDWKAAASLGRKHRPNVLANGQRALCAPSAMKLLPSATAGQLAGRAIRRVIGETS